MDQETAAGSESALNVFLRELGLLELELTKASLVTKLSEDEINQYGHLEEKIQSQIDAAEKDIALLQEELANERLVRQRKEECEALASQVNTEVPRAVSEAAVAEVEAELQTLRDREQGVLGQLDLRRKQFQLLMHAVAELSQTLKQ
ncbi:THO complex subunit 7-like [Hondaea fermentalgiana]|uniref:THO complex subunit 7-like n=1 Tax=Hondaea fermentalgiana TaxID=2315210 RepID=A0A2R5GXD1_9STRA|nr:THO complex subunit 7-like [Hondaea fermentalgiana]|eukprot:GBG32614.1 THO complex subunit 7-like [Hondaea fermentalgiana]